MLADVKVINLKERWDWFDQRVGEGWRGRTLERGMLHVAAQLHHWEGSQGTGELGGEHRLVGRRWWGVHRRKHLHLRSLPLPRWSSHSSRCSQFLDWWNNTHPKWLAFVTKSRGEKKHQPSKALVPAFRGELPGTTGEEEAGDGEDVGREEGGT